MQGKVVPNSDLVCVDVPRLGWELLSDYQRTPNIVVDLY